nr:MAG TPA: hypothetical protein [Caudoviricetes sp.]
MTMGGGNLPLIEYFLLTFWLTIVFISLDDTML